MLYIIGSARSTTGTARSRGARASSTEVLRKVFSTTSMSVPLLV
jgi:hypothetical protein